MPAFSQALCLLAYLLGVKWWGCGINRLHDAKQGQRLFVVYQGYVCIRFSALTKLLFTSMLLGTKYKIQKPTLVKVLVIRDWMLLVVVLKVLQLWAMRRAAKSRKAQWLSTSGRKHSCLLTIHVTTAGMSSCSYKYRQKNYNIRIKVFFEIEKQ